MLLKSILIVVFLAFTTVDAKNVFSFSDNFKVAVYDQSGCKGNEILSVTCEGSKCNNIATAKSIRVCLDNSS